MSNHKTQEEIIKLCSDYTLDKLKYNLENFTHCYDCEKNNDDKCSFELTIIMLSYIKRLEELSYNQATIINTSDIAIKQLKNELNSLKESNLKNHEELEK